MPQFLLFPAVTAPWQLKKWRVYKYLVLTIIVASLLSICYVTSQLLFPSYGKAEIIIQLLSVLLRFLTRIFMHWKFGVGLWRDPTWKCTLSRVLLQVWLAGRLWKIFPMSSPYLSQIPLHSPLPSPFLSSPLGHSFPLFPWTTHSIFSSGIFNYALAIIYHLFSNISITGCWITRSS